ncbi:MAG: hypothetical protein BWY75_03618 [bacterium ADurb.Bin425]|nr:MAG: hypothetical protein BWY75_03618 [bacterium ADurb.Bin425]
MIGIDNIVKEANTKIYSFAKTIKIEVGRIGKQKLSYVYRAQITRITRSQRLLAAGISGLDIFCTRNNLSGRIKSQFDRVLGIDSVYKDYARFAGGMCINYYFLKELTGFNTAHH